MKLNIPREWFESKAHLEEGEIGAGSPVFSNCNVCGRDLIRDDELAIGMCAICANEEIQSPPDQPKDK